MLLGLVCRSCGKQKWLIIEGYWVQFLQPPTYHSKVCPVSEKEWMGKNNHRCLADLPVLSKSCHGTRNQMLLNDTVMDP